VLSRAEAFAKLILGILIVLVSVSVFSYIFRAPAYSISTIARVAAAKCPGIPGGSGSGGPDYINITIDFGLVGLFVLFLMLTVKDMRKRKRLGVRGT
jgi:hypothetical protein